MDYKEDKKNEKKNNDLLVEQKINNLITQELNNFCKKNK